MEQQPNGGGGGGGNKLAYQLHALKNQGSYSPTILKNVLGLVLHIFLYLAVFKCNKTSDWPKPYGLAQSEVVLHSNFTKSWREDKECC